jgi:hypothetical protein
MGSPTLAASGPPPSSPRTRRRGKLLAVFALLAPLGVAPAGASAAGNIIHLSGFVWEDGGFPKSVFGDELQGVGLITHVVAPLYWSPTSRSYTWYMRQLFSLGTSVYGTTQVVEYSGGLLTIYVDTLPSNHDYGILPPNATSPSTFTDGFAVYLDGYFTDFTLTYDSVTSSGSFLGSLVFTAGNVFPQLESPEGWTLGSDLGGIAPLGYDLSVNGSIHVAGPLGLRPSSWGAVKGLYR